MNVAIFAIDPGRSTGIAWGIVNPHARLASEAMRHRIHSGSTTITGSPIEQARLLWNYWAGFRGDCFNISLLPYDRIHLVSEDFMLTPNATPGKNTTAPERIIYAFEGYRTGRHDTYRKSRHFAPVTWQTPASASRFNSQAMLKPVNAWIKGKEHERSAFAHMYLYTATLLDRRPL